MTEIFVPITLFLTIGGVFAIAIYMKYRARHDVQHTVRVAIERGETLSPELVETLAMSIAISLALGAAGFGFAVLLGEEGAMGPLMAISTFPILVGIAYLGLWFFIGRKRADG